MATLRPLGSRLVVKKIEALRTTASGLLIIDALASRPNTGEVIAVGPDVKEVSVGDHILFAAGAGQELKVDGQTVHVMSEIDLYAVTNGDDIHRLRAIKKNILFQFLDETGGSKGAFTERTKGPIVIATLKDAQTQLNRWGKVVAVGPEVQGIEPGQYVLVAAQKWSRSEDFGREKIWRTADIDEAVMAVTDDVNHTYQY